jgi:mannose-1-phosphate guanylyltransferase
MRPKQLLALTGTQTMLQSTVSRLDGLMPSERIWIATGKSLAEPIAEQLPELPHSNILVEPCKRDTAACIGLAALALIQKDPEAVMAVMPSDHVIAEPGAFQQALLAADELVRERPDRIVTFGIKPTYPAESFGYIERGKALDNHWPAAEGLNLYRVAKFREKPAATVAREYVDSGKFYWNSGIFVWSARTILAALNHHQPELARRLQSIQQAWDKPGFAEILDREFSAIRGISIDYAVMEHARDVVVIEAPFTWDDVGSWQAIARLDGADADGNTVRAKHLGINTSGTIVRSDDDHLIVTLGLRDCIVVRTIDATLIARKQDEESIRQVVKALEEKNWKEFL